MTDLRAQSKHHQFANQKLFWFGQDSEELYNQNLKKKYDDLVKYDWINKNIIYQFNSFGFRSIEFQDKPNIVFLGASDTLGTALPMDATWASLVASELNLLPFNLGQGGGCNDTSYRLSSYWINVLKPLIVVLLVSIKSRFELVSTEPIELQTVAVSNLRNETKEYFINWASSEMNLILNAEKNKLAIQKICEQHNIKFISLDAESDFQKIDRARDLIHAGINSNIQLANKVLSLL